MADATAERVAMLSRRRAGARGASRHCRVRWRASAPQRRAPRHARCATSLRLSPSQYRLTIADIFDDSIKISGRFEPEQRDQGLLAIGARTAEHHRQRPREL